MTMMMMITYDDAMITINDDKSDDGMLMDAMILVLLLRVYILSIQRVMCRCITQSDWTPAVNRGLLNA